MHVDLASADEVVFLVLPNPAGGYWIYRCTGFFARFFWLRGFSPFLADHDPMRTPPPKFVSFFKLLGPLTMWNAVAAPILYFVLRITGIGTVDDQ